MDREQVTNCLLTITTSDYASARKRAQSLNVHTGIVLLVGTPSVYPEHAQSLMFIIVHGAHVTCALSGHLKEPLDEGNE